MNKQPFCGQGDHTDETAELQDELTGALIGLAKSCQNNEKTENTDRIIIEGLSSTITNAAIPPETLREMIQAVHEEKARIVPDCSSCMNPCGNTSDYDMKELQNAPEDIRSLKSLILLVIRTMAAYAYRALVLGYTDPDINLFFYKALSMISYDLEIEDLLPVVLEAGKVNLKCMALLDKAEKTDFVE